MCQLHQLQQAHLNQLEHDDYSRGMLIASIYNTHRDPKKGKAVEWWEFMPRWIRKYKVEAQLAKEENLKAWLISKSSNPPPPDPENPFGIVKEKIEG